ncbi:MAG TPA: hypothetical protein VK395_02035 [Gemmataceae bacterium]|nr:hypothetical protein [Gemmataceae bacterium]
MPASKSQLKGLLHILAAPRTLLPSMCGVSAAVLTWVWAKPREYIVLWSLVTIGWVVTCILLGKSSHPRVDGPRQLLLDSLDPANSAGWRPCPAAELTATAAQTET